MANVKKNTDGHNYKYADLAQVNDYLESIGYSYYQEIQTEWNPVTGEPIDYIWTTPIIDGASKPSRRGCRVEQATLRGVNNPAQEQGSAITYARRYSVLMAFGLATEDDDAAMLSTVKKPVVQNKLTNEQAFAIHSLLERTGVDVTKFLGYYKAKAVEDMTADTYEHAVAQLNKKIPQDDTEYPECLQ